MGGGLSVAEQQLVDGNDSVLSLLSGPRSLPPNHAFWNRLHEIRFALDHLDKNQVTRVVNIVCQRMIQNNLGSRNLNVLLGLVCEKLGDILHGAPLSPGTTNLVFLARTFMKAFCESLNSEQLRQHLESTFTDSSHAIAIVILPEHEQSKSDLALPERLMTLIVDTFLKVEATNENIDFLLELSYLLLVLLSTQLYQDHNGNNLFLDLFFARLDSKIPAVCEKLLYLFSMKSPASAFSPIHSPKAKTSWLSLIGHSFMNMFLWPFQIYRILFSKKETNSLLSDSAAFLFLLLVHQTGDKTQFKTAVSGISDIDNDFSVSVSGRVSFDRLFEALVQCLFHKTARKFAILLLFTLIRYNRAFCEFIYSKSDVDVLVMPLLEMAYTEERFDSNQMYMIIVILLILTNDDSFCDNAHRRLIISNVPWFTEFLLQDISLGSLVMTVLLQTMQKNQAASKDTYLHSNCLAALCNLSPHATNLHEHTAQRLVSLLAALSRRYTRIAKRLSQQEQSMDRITDQHLRRNSFCDDDVSVESMSTFGEFIRLLLDAICACLSSGNLAENISLLYCLMHDQKVLEPFNHDPEFGVVAQHLWILVHNFIDRLNLRCLPENSSVSAIQDVLRFEARSYKFPAEWDVPAIQKFCYEDSDETAVFFLAFSWEIVFRSCPISWIAEDVKAFDVSVLDDVQSQTRNILDNIEQPNATHNSVNIDGKDPSVENLA